MFDRLDRLRRRRRTPEDEGFILVYVMLIITIITVIVTGTMIVTTSNIVPAVKTSYSQAADAAAQGGMQAFLADLNTRCSSGANSTVSTCSPASATTSWTTINQTGSYVARYRWSKVTRDTTNNWFRVTVEGNVNSGGITASRTITADLVGGASTSCLDYTLCTQYETQSPDVMKQLFPGRQIALTSSGQTAANALSGNPSSVTWQAPNTTATAGSLATCNTIYLGTNGRRANTPAGGSFTDWTQTTTSGSVTSYQPCQVSLGSSTKLLAPTTTADGAGGYYTADALLVSNSNPGSTSGPLLNQPVYTGYQGADDPSGVAGRNYRAFVLPGYNPQVGGAPDAASTYPNPRYVSSGPRAISASPTIAASGACVYSGPTRVKLNSDGTATVTSPLTTTKATGSPSGCYPTSVTGGIYQFTTAALTSLSGFNGTFSVKNAYASGSTPPNSALPACNAVNPTPVKISTTGWGLTCQRASDGAANASAANTVFYKDSGSVASGADPSGSSAPYTCTSTYSAAINSTCAWTGVYTTTDGNGSGTNGWTSYTSGTNCTNSLASTDRLAFECDFNGGSVGTPHDYYSILRDRVRIDLSRSTCLTGTVAAQQTCIQTFLTNELNPANNSSHRYIVTAATPVSTGGTKTLSPNAPPLSSDSFFDSSSSPGVPSTETLTSSQFTYTISRQVYKCYGVVVLGVCLLNVGGAVLGYQWGSDTTANASTPQFTVTVGNQNVSNFVQGSVGKSFFPYLADASQYSVGTGGATGTNGPGDLYVEGTATRSLALVAANDAIVTGTLKPATATTSGLQLVGQNNVRVYHPVSCVTNDNTNLGNTTPGFCPNDVTGLYTAIPADGSRPYQQYSNLRADLSGMTITASIFALGNASSSVACLQWNSGGICGGQFMADNYARGATLGTLSVTGSVTQVHHGAVGEEWEVPDRTGQTRPQSGYNLTARYQNLKSLTSGVNTVDISGSATPTAWHIVSVSMGGS